MRQRHNENLNGNYGKYLIQDATITIGDVTVATTTRRREQQVCDDVTVEYRRCINNTDLGLHAGSGSERSIVRGCTLTGNGQGFFFCWGVRDSIVEDCVIEDSRTIGISIGHRDTDNVVRNNLVRRSGVNGILFRQHPEPKRDPHRNLFEGNLIEDSGAKGECVAVEMLGAAGT